MDLIRVHGCLTLGSLRFVEVCGGVVRPRRVPQHLFGWATDTAACREGRAIPTRTEAHLAIPRTSRIGRRTPSHSKAALVATLVASVALSLGVVPAMAASGKGPAPTKLRLVAGQSSIVASWSVASTKGVTGFRIRWGRKHGKSAKMGRRVVLSSGARSYTISSLAKGTYEVRVLAVYANRAGRGSVAEATVSPGGKEGPGEEKERKEQERKEREARKEQERKEREEAHEREQHEKEEREGKEHEEKEKTGSSNAVSATPDGPSGSWSIVYGDAFAGSSLDNTWKANTNRQGCCGNGNEISTERPSAVKVDSQGLHILCEYVATPVEGSNYVCGGVDTEHGFEWKANGGGTLAFQVVTKWPARDGGEDPGWWAFDHTWTSELDFFEGWEWGHEEYYAGMPVFIGETNTILDTVSHELFSAKSEISNPETEYHTYTTVLKPNDQLEEYIDGKYRWTVAPPLAENTPWMHLTLTHDLREATKLKSTSDFAVRSVSVYEDAAHDGVGIEDGGIAPGTSVE